MAQDEIFLSDEAMEHYNKEVEKQKKEQTNIVTWTPENEIKEIKKEGQVKTKISAEKIEKPKRKYTKKPNLITNLITVICEHCGKVTTVDLNKK